MPLKYGWRGLKYVCIMKYVWKMVQHIRCLSWIQVHTAEWTSLDLTLFLNDLAYCTKQLLVKTHTSILATGFSPSLLYLLLISNSANENSSAYTKHIRLSQFPLYTVRDGENTSFIFLKKTCTDRKLINFCRLIKSK